MVAFEIMKQQIIVVILPLGNEYILSLSCLDKIGQNILVNLPTMDLVSGAGSKQSSYSLKGLVKKEIASVERQS